MVVPVAEADFDLLSGTPKIYVKVAESGRNRQQAFCSDCGTPIYAASDDDGPRTIGLRVGAIQQRSELTPNRQYWCRSAVKWLDSMTDIERFEKQ